jgi:hypothetical protein
MSLPACSCGHENQKSYTDEDTIESALRQARQLGLVVVLPRSNELFVDIDDEASMHVFLASVARLGDVSYLVRRSPSGAPGRRHITVTMPRAVTAMERIALQAMLGSDRVREILSWQRLQRGINEPTLFFESARGPG